MQVVVGTLEDFAGSDGRRWPANESSHGGAEMLHRHALTNRHSRVRERGLVLGAIADVLNVPEAA